MADAVKELAAFGFVGVHFAGTEDLAEEVEALLFAEGFKVKGGLAAEKLEAGLAGGDEHRRLASRDESAG